MDYRTRLKDLLRELFQFDAADLDFGIYRILNQRRAEIDVFIERGLLDIVVQELGALQEGVVAQKKTELDQLRGEVVRSLGDGAFDGEGNIVQTYRQLPLALRYVEKQEEVRRTTVSVEVEAEIFNALYTFFSRYYDEGDFVTQRRYSRQPKYAVPYNGEEVLLHWANRDQYYVKTADTLTDYVFRIEAHGGYRVAFKLAAADTEQNNVKGQKRSFLPVPENLAAFDQQRCELSLYFAYRPLTEDEEAEFGKSRVQEKIIAARIQGLLAAVPEATLRGLLAALPPGKDISLLEAHLRRWTRKSTSDYFIHKDLKGFLEGELDFYLKNEVMRLDDVDSANEAQVGEYLTRLKVIRRIGRKIIAFLAQIEDFQKGLFEKPKFVLQSEWCVTLDRVPEALYPQIAANEAQWAQWASLALTPSPSPSGRGEQERVEYLRAHPSLMVDTGLYEVAFKDALLEALSAREGGLEAQRDGLLIHSENYQALTLLLQNYQGCVDCLFIDPPYNTGNDDFVYKDNYRHSSWITMMQSRLELGMQLMSKLGSLWITIDDKEVSNCRMIGETIFGVENFVTAISWQKVYSPRMDAKRFSTSCDTILVFSRDLEWKPNRLDIEPDLTQFPHIDETGSRYRSDPLRKWGKNSLRENRPNLWFPIKSPDGVDVWPIKPDGRDGCWRWSREKVAAQSKELDWLDKGNGVQPYVRQYAEESTIRPPETLWFYEDTGSTHEAQEELKALLPGNSFTTPKPSRLIMQVLRTASRKRSIVLDFFAGSGTTGHAVIQLNRQDGENRRYILVEQGSYFHSVLKPRLQKVVYAAKWRDGKPVEGTSGISHAFQYLALESYEDTLDNLDLEKEAAPPPGLFPPERDDYLLRYFLDHETHRARLDPAIFDSPFRAAIRVRRDGVETRLPLDLVETANFLLGLEVHERRACTHQGRTYRLVRGQRGRRSVALVWRDADDLDLQAEAVFLQAEFFAQRRPDRLYINGDSLLPGARPVQQVFAQAMLEPPAAAEAD